MPNHVKNKITFACDAALAERILREIKEEREDGRAIDFNALIPCPLSIYRGSLSSTDNEDFGENTWYQWNRKHWGTKWNCYSASVENQNGHVTLLFKTACNIPYPFIIAFANKYGLEFTYKYYDEGGNFWGIEKWNDGERIERDRDNKEIEDQLFAELFGDTRSARG